MPLDVPNAIDDEIAIHVGRPKFLLPTSENAWPVIFLNFVQRITSQGESDVSAPSDPCSS